LSKLDLRQIKTKMISGPCHRIHEGICFFLW